MIVISKTSLLFFFLEKEYSIIVITLFYKV